MGKLLFATLFAAAFLSAQDYSLGPDSQPQPGVPKGTVAKYVLAAGQFYPGAPHNYSVYVPARYDANKPAPFMIFLDGSGMLGNNMRAPTVFDNLIAKGDLPPLIGVFIDPGVLPMLSDQAQNRFERIFEYDSVNGRYARFLLEELIPEVAKKYNLSKDPNDHAISGVSTGAVGAFMAAWERPDQFRRVLSFIGTFVAMKGADALPALIRKTEPKPIRVFLQDGTNDHIVPGEPYGTFYAGSWPANNQIMYEALEYAGYDVKLAMGTGGHDGRQGAAIMPDALRWLWREYPKPIVVHEPPEMGKPGWDPRGQVFAILSADQPWRQVGGTYPSAASPAVDKEGNVFFAAGARIYKSDEEGHVTVFRENSAVAKALRFGPDGRLYASQPARSRIVSYGPAGDEKVVAQGVEAGDLALTAKGEIYFIDSASKGVGFIDAAGRKRVAYGGGEIAAPTALTLTPDQALLIVGDGQTRFSWSFQISAGGALEDGEPYFRLDMPETSPVSGVAGIAVDSTGEAYFADAIGIQVCEPIGRCAQILSKPEPGVLTSIAFGGKDLNWLYVTEAGKLFRRRVKPTGVTAWAPVKPPRPPL
ncbi:MAG: alpha/beta hydrolase-fold protein [Bryobacteraceae bacterium]